MTFRFILQPAMAIIAALRDGVSDARLGRTPYSGRRSCADEERSARLWEGIVSTARILILGVVMDIVYQWLVLENVLPGPVGGDRDFAGVCPLSAVARPHSSASRVIGSLDPQSS